MIAAGLATAALTGLAVGLALGVRRLAPLVLSVYVLTVAQIVGLIELLSAFRAVTARNVFAAQVALFASSIVLVGTRRREIGVDLPVGVRRTLRSRPLVAILLAVVLGALGYELALGLLTPPNNWDSMTYHLSRAAAWYQHHGVAYVDAPNQRENADPPNAEILILYTFLFAHGDRFAAVWQWLAEVGSLVAIFMIARRLGSGRAQALLAASVFGCLSQVVLQSVTTQNDLVAGSLVVTSVAFVTSAERHRLALAAVAFGLAVGTKFTTVFALPVLAAVGFTAVPKREWKRLLVLTAMATAAFGALGYVLNLVLTGSFLGNPSATGGLHQTGLVGFARTAGRIALDLVSDVRGLGLAGLPASEDASYFGLLGAGLIVPAIALTLFRWRRGRATVLEATLALALPVYVLLLSAASAFDPFMGRFLITPVALLAPLFAGALRTRSYAAIAAIVAAATLTSNLLLDQGKPAGLTGGRSIWAMTRIEAQSIQDPPMQPLLEALAALVPSTAHIGYVLGGNDWVYPLYGRRLTRKLIQLDPGTAYAQASREHLTWILVRRSWTPQPGPAWRALPFPSTGLVLFEHRTA